VLRGCDGCASGGDAQDERHEDDSQGLRHRSASLPLDGHGRDPDRIVGASARGGSVRGHRR
jgi:hypothetical protein